MFYTYLWLREDGSPYYVGKGSGFRGFASYGHRVKCPKDPERIITQDWLSEEQALEAEKFLIGYYGRIDLGTGCLANLTDGGEGVSGGHWSLSSDTKQRMRAWKRKPHSTESRRKISEAKSGHKHSEEQRRNMAESRRGKKRKPFSEEHRRHLGDVNRGRKHPADCNHCAAVRHRGE